MKKTKKVEKSTEIKKIEAFAEKKEGKLIAVASSEIKDRMGDIVLSAGWQLKNFKKNPVLLFGHNYNEPPIGIAKNIKISGKSLVFEPTFHGITQLSREIKAMFETIPPVMKAFSVGFIPLEFDENDNKIIKKQELLEISAVPVPANQEALVTSAKSYTPAQKTKVEDWVLLAMKHMGETKDDKEEEKEEEKTEESETEKTKPEDEKEEETEGEVETEKEEESEDSSDEEDSETETDDEEETEESEIDKPADVEEKPFPNEHACRIRSPAGYDRIRRNNCFREHDGKCIDYIFGIKENKAEVQSLRYPKKTWTASSARTHCKNAKGSFEVASGAKKIERWNKTLSKVFDIAGVESKPSSFSYDLFTKFLECKIKDVFLNSYLVPSPLMGTYLAGFKKILSEFELKDTRNFTYNGLELPPIYEVIQLNSEKSDDFLVHGTRFYVANGKPLIVKYTPGWSGIDISVITSSENKDWNKVLMKEAHNWVKENNFLKGEKFALNGEFLSTNNCEDWDEIMLDKDIKEPVMKSVKFLNQKGKELVSRGLLFIGVPGTGKTLTGRTIMKEANSTFIWVSSKDFERFSPTVVLSLAFKLARELAPTVVFIEDIDTWLGGHSIDLLKTELDGIRVNKGVITILTSNTPEKLPDALIDRPGRFHDVLKFDLPNKKIRKKMIIKWAFAEKIKSESVSELFIDKIVEETEGYSGAHIKELVRYAKMIAEDEKIKMEEALIQSLEKLNKQRDLIREIKKEKEEKTGKAETKKLIEEALLEVKRLEAEMKAGRVISSKNRVKIENTISTMKLAISSLQELLRATEATTAKGGEVKSENGRREEVCKPAMDAVMKRALVQVNKNISNILRLEKLKRKR